MGLPELSTGSASCVPTVLVAADVGLDAVDVGDVGNVGNADTGTGAAWIDNSTGPFGEASDEGLSPGVEVTGDIWGNSPTMDFDRRRSVDAKSIEKPMRRAGRRDRKAHIPLF
jgi:hypothetical protein